MATLLPQQPVPAPILFLQPLAAFRDKARRRGFLLAERHPENING